MSLPGEVVFNYSVTWYASKLTLVHTFQYTHTALLIMLMIILSMIKTHSGSKDIHILRNNNKEQ